MNRIFKTGLISTIIGILSLIYIGIVLYQEKFTPEEMAGWFLFATAMIRANDTILGLKRKSE